VLVGLVTISDHRVEAAVIFNSKSPKFIGLLPINYIY
jgi:hypothetical protein